MTIRQRLLGWPIDPIVDRCINIQLSRSVTYRHFLFRLGHRRSCWLQVMLNNAAKFHMHLKLCPCFFFLTGIIDMVSCTMTISGGTLSPDLHHLERICFFSKRSLLWSMSLPETKVHVRGGRWWNELANRTADCRPLYPT